MKLKTLTLASLIILASLSMVISAKAAETPNGPHIITSGIGRVDTTPDIAIITVEVNASAKDVAAAKQQVDNRVTQYFDFLIKNKIEKKDIDSANLVTQPEYDYPKTGSTLLKGYRAIRQLHVTVRQLDKLNVLLDGALKYGLNRIQDVKLAMANPDVYREQARKKAIANAISIANSLAEGFNVKLGPIYSVHYHADNAQPTPIMFNAVKAASPNITKTYQQEIIHFDDQVDVVFKLEK